MAKKGYRPIYVFCIHCGALTRKGKCTFCGKNPVKKDK